MSADNINGNVLVNPLFIQTAVEAGIASVIRSIVNGQPMGLVELVIAVRTALWDVNRPLAEGLNQHTMNGILNYLSLVGEGVAVNSQQVPQALDMDGPAGVFTSYGSGQLNVTWSTPPEGFYSQIVVDGVIVKYSTATDTNDDNADDSVTIALDAGDHAVRVVYRRISDGALSRLSAASTVTVA